MPDKIILVTGGAGFIGSHLCEALLADGYRVRVVDDLSMGRVENVPRECEFLEGSVHDKAVLERAMPGVFAICHEAARVTIRGSLDKFYEDAETNLMGTLALLRSAGEHRVKRFIYASSMAVYADSPKPMPVSESHTTNPISPYGIAKLAAEQYLLLVAPPLGIQPVVLRYFNTFGTRQTYTPYVGVITIFVTRLLKKEGITIYGKGDQVRDFVHVSDIVQANLLSLRSSVSGSIFNVGTGRGTSVIELAELLKEMLYPAATIHYQPARAEELRNSIADISGISQSLGYQPGTDLRKQIAEVIDSLRIA